MPAAVKSPEPMVEARNLTVGHGGQPVIEDASFELPAGAVTAVVGPNGSGKTTVLHAIAGLLTPTHGRLRVLGGDPPDVRRRVAYVLQAPRVDEDIPVTARE